MKHFYALLLFLLPAGLSAQQTVDISESYSLVYLNSNCPTPANASVYVYAITTGLIPATDNVDVFIDFGDGNNTLTSQPVYYNSPADQVMYYSTSHSYLTPGVYTVTVIVTTPNSTDDTLIINGAVAVTNTCNNLTGRMYRDNNSNCVYDGGDVVLQYQQVGIRPAGSTGQFSMSNTSVTGQYQASTLTGTTYEVIANSYMPGVPMSCMNDTVVFTSTGSDVVDFALAPVTVVTAVSVTDSVPSVCYGNGYTYISGHVKHYGDGSAGTATVYLAFGDGNDTTFTVPLADYASPQFQYGYFGLQHYYAAPGTYSLMYIASDPVAGVSDTLYAWNEVELIDSCGAITGTVFADVNTNCSLDGGDTTLPNAYILLYQNNVYYTADWADSSGLYAFNVLPGNYTIELGNYANLGGYSMTCSSTFTRAVTLLPATMVTEDFGLVCTANAGDAAADLQGGPFRPSTAAHLYPYLYSNSCIPTSGTATLILDPQTTYSWASNTSLPVTVTGNTLSWPYSVSTGLSWYTYFGLFVVNVSPSAQIGDTLCFMFYITPSGGDANSANDTFYFCRPVTNSYDPNIKEASPAGPGGNGHVAPNTEMTYTIHFQNTGNDVAYNIAITDTIDPNLDMSTLQILGSSHTMVPDVTGSNILRFNFYNINLPDSTSNEPMSHGWVTYRIDPYQWLPDGTQIDNTAYIYFDFNEAIITNTTNTIVDWALSINEVEIRNGFTAAPVPANDYVNVSFDRNFTGTVTLRDISGREVKQVKMNGTKESIYVGDLAGGVYTISVANETGMITQKIVVQH